MNPSAGGGDAQVFVGLGVYLLVMIAIGVWSSRRIRGLDDFLLGGRRLGPWVTAISERASGESAWFLMGLPGAAYATGFFEFWSVIGIAFGILASWITIALPLRRASARLGVLTLPEYFVASYPRIGVPIRAIAALSIVVFYVSYLGAQILGAGKLFQQLFGWESLAGGALLGAGIVCLYTLLGGFLAVAWTDLLQGIMMAAVSVLLPVVVLSRFGIEGIGDAILAVREESFFAMGRFALDPSFAAQAGEEVLEGFGFGAILGGLAWGLGYLGQPHLLTRYMAIEKPRELRRSTGIAVGWVLLSYWGVTLAGMLAIPVLGGEIGDNELVLVDLIRALLPAWLAGFLIAGILAAIMSTADSQLLVATSAVVEDVAVRWWRVRLTQKGVVLLSRIATVAITLIALLPLLWEESQKMIYGIVAYAWTGLGATFGPALILSLWWRRTSGGGVLLGMITGMASTILWKNTATLQGLLDLKITAFLCSLSAVIDLKIAAFLCSLVAVIAGSFILPRRSG